MKSGRVVPSSVGAVKNGRRKMEDRHVVIHDMNVIFEDEHNPQVGQIQYQADGVTLLAFVTETVIQQGCVIPCFFGPHSAILEQENFLILTFRLSAVQN